MNIRKFIDLIESLTEFENIKLIPNIKPQRVFDEKYNVDISGHYNFPFNLGEDVVWSIMMQDEYSHLQKRLITALSYNHFPYQGVEKLNDSVKKEILLGMSSGFNFDDIVWWAIMGKTGLDEKNNFREENIQIKNAFIREFGEEFYMMDINWIPSFPTFERIKEKLKGNLNIYN